jgi:hypothetical protein
MDGAPDASFSNAADHQRLDVGGLDLDVGHHAISDCRERRGEGRNLHAFGERVPPEILGGEIRDSRCTGGRGFDTLVVVHNDYSIPGGVDIELDRVGADLDRLFEGRNGVFGKGLVRAPVGDRFGGRPSWLGQDFLT